jgi:hypothetical protein
VTFAVLGVLVVWATIGSAASLGLISKSLTPYRTCTVTATPASSSAATDASVRQGSSNANFGTSNTNNIATANGANRRLYIRFDLTICSPALAANSVIRLATLRLYLTAVPSSCRTIDIFRATSTWGESTLTWTNQPFGTSINSPPGALATDTFSVGAPAGCGNQSGGAYAIGAVVTPDVVAYVAGQASNFGWMLRDDVENSTTTYTSTISAKDLGTVPQAPQIVITYVTTP